MIRRISSFTVHRRDGLDSLMTRNVRHSPLTRLIACLAAVA